MFLLGRSLRDRRARRSTGVSYFVLWVRGIEVPYSLTVKDNAEEARLIGLRARPSHHSASQARKRRGEDRRGEKKTGEKRLDRSCKRKRQLLQYRHRKPNTITHFSIYFRVQICSSLLLLRWRAPLDFILSFPPPFSLSSPGRVPMWLMDTGVAPCVYLSCLFCVVSCPADGVPVEQIQAPRRVPRRR